MTEEKKEFNPIKTNIVSGVVIEKEGKYLLVQEKQKKVYGLWNLPAGLAEKDLTLEENAVKEAKEETGYDVKIIKKIGVFQDKKESSAKSAFEAEIIGGELRYPENEILNAKWFSFEEILKMKDKLRDNWIIDAINLLDSIKKTEEYLNNWKRTQADLENYKKEQARRMEEFQKFTKSDFIMQILPVLDNFHASTDHIPEDQKKSPWVHGIMHIQKQLENVLKDNGVEEIPVKVGDEFNPEMHEAVQGDTKETNNSAKETNKIIKILRKGYQMSEKVIRAAKVIVG